MRRTRIETDSLDASLRVITDLYTPVRADAPAQVCRTRFAVASHEVDGFRVDRLHHSTGYRLTAEPMDFTGVVTLGRGQATYAVPGHAVRFTRGRSLLFPAHEPLRVEHSAYDLRLVVLPADRLAERAADVHGAGELALRMDLATSTSAADEARWTSTVDYLHDELTRPDSAFDSPLFRANALMLLLDVALSVFPSNLPEVQGRPRPPGPPRAVRDAVGFIEACADRPVTARDIAAVTGVRPVELDTAFRRVHGMSSAGYLRQVRLQRAEHDLDVATAEGPALQPAEIRGILTRWGFSTPERYASLYRKTFDIRSAHATPTRSR